MSAPRHGYVHLNGRLVAAARARVSVFDRGLLYGDGLFDTLRAYRGRPFGLDDHVARLRASAEFLGITVPARHWGRQVAALLRANGLLRRDAAVRISLTRGVGVPRLLPPPGLRPTVLITAVPISPSIRAAQRHGVGVTLLPFARNGFLAEHKTLCYLPAILGKVIAARQRAFEGVFVDAQNLAREGTTSNLFVWLGDELVTPVCASILPGVTRRLVIQAAIADGSRVAERPLTIDDLSRAEEAFLTSSVAEIVPVVMVSGQAVGNGHVGQRTRRLQELYRQIVDRTLTKT